MVGSAKIKHHIQAILPVNINYRTTPLIRTLVIRISNYPERLGPSGKHFLTLL
jgi:hypothetical protein